MQRPSVEAPNGRKAVTKVTRAFSGHYRRRQSKGWHKVLTHVYDLSRYWDELNDGNTGTSTFWVKNWNQISFWSKNKNKWSHYCYKTSSLKHWWKQQPICGNILGHNSKINGQIAKHHQLFIFFLFSVKSVLILECMNIKFLQQQCSSATDCFVFPLLSWIFTVFDVFWTQAACDAAQVNLMLKIQIR